MALTLHLRGLLGLRKQRKSRKPSKPLKWSVVYTKIVKSLRLDQKIQSV